MKLLARYVARVQRVVRRRFPAEEAEPRVAALERLRQTLLR